MKMVAGTSRAFTGSPTQRSTSSAGGREAGTSRATPSLLEWSHMQRAWFQCSQGSLLLLAFGELADTALPGKVGADGPASVAELAAMGTCVVPLEAMGTISQSAMLDRPRENCTCS